MTDRPKCNNGKAEGEEKEEEEGAKRVEILWH